MLVGPSRGWELTEAAGPCRERPTPAILVGTLGLQHTHTNNYCPVPPLARELSLSGNKLMNIGDSSDLHHHPEQYYLTKINVLTFFKIYFSPFHLQRLKPSKIINKDSSWPERKDWLVFIFNFLYHSNVQIISTNRSPSYLFLHICFKIMSFPL